MADWTLSIVIIVPADLREKANRLACALGHDVLPGDTFTVPLSDDGETVTHYGTRTQAKQAFVDILTAAAEGELPEGFPCPLEDVQEVIAAMILNERTDGEITTHFDDVLAANGLQRMEVATEGSDNG